jgi:lactoylglutathione lyase
LAFANFSMADGHFPNGYVRADNPIPLGMEIALVTDDVTAAHIAALAAGGVEVSKPSQKPWGQVVSYVRAPNGVLVELCSPMG